MAKKRYFALIQNGKEVAVFSGKQPRQAALKAATRNYKDIKLRERGTKKIHIYKGSRTQVNAPANRPSWMPAKIWKSNVKKAGIEKIVKKKKR